MKKKAILLCAALAMTATSAHATQSKQQNIVMGVSPWWGGTGCQNHIPWFMKWFEELAC